MANKFKDWDNTKKYVKSPYHANGARIGHLEVLSEEIDEQYSEKVEEAYEHSQIVGNPHGTTKSDVGLGNVDDTSDLDKPISNAQQTALNSKLNTSEFNTYAFNYSQQPLSSYHVTYAEMEALTGMSAGDRVYCTTYNQEMIYDPFFGWHPVGIMIPELGYEFIDENIALNTAFVYAGVNGGATGFTTNVTLSPTKITGLTTEANSNGESRHMTPNYFTGGMGKKQYKTKVCVNTLSNMTNRYVVQVGYSTTNTGVGDADGMYFLYDEGGVFGSATASPNWLCICRNGGSYEIINSGVAVTNTSSLLQSLEIKDYGTGNKVEFYIDSVPVATIVSSIPNNLRFMYIGERIAKISGTDPRVLYNDFSLTKEKFNTPRM